METGGIHTRVVWAGLLLGVGLGGFVDGIVFHQLLQWHHLLSSHPAYPPTTLAGLRANTFWDGVFHAATFAATVAGLALLWGAARRPHATWSTRLVVGLSLMGWGAFNLVDGVVEHVLLGLHHANETVPPEQRGAWDLGFLLWGAVMLLGGWALVRAGEREQAAAARDARVGRRAGAAG